MAKNKECPKNHMWFPPENRCIPLKGTIHTKAVQQEIGAVVIGSALLGGVLGWMFRDSEQDEIDQREYIESLVSEYNLDRFIRNIADLDMSELDDEKIDMMIDEVGDGIVFRWSQSEDEDDINVLLEDLDVLQQVLMFSALNDGEKDQILPLDRKIEEFKTAILDGELDRELK